MHVVVELMIDPCFLVGANFLFLLLHKSSWFFYSLTDKVVVCNFLSSVQYFVGGVHGLLPKEGVPPFQSSEIASCCSRWIDILLCE